MSKLNPATSNFLLRLNRVLRLFATREEIKFYIGDSTNNHRTPTVNQCIRYLAKLDIVDLSVTLSSTYKFLQDQGFFSKVRSKNFRIDALDINEYFSVVQTQLIKASPNVKAKFTKLVKA